VRSLVSARAGQGLSTVAVGGSRDLIQRVHYEVEIVFAGELPAVTEVRHVPDPGTEQFATTGKRPDA